jgi:murein DD-endopeptidase MepM/ murein hydrolase activator NlpD
MAAEQDRDGETEEERERNSKWAGHHVYQYPFGEDVPIDIAEQSGPLSHPHYTICAHAVDFLMPVDTPVLAARGGRVFVLKDDSDKWGFDADVAEEVNYVAVDHGDGTYAEYVHIKKDSVVVEVGQQVEAGELLANTGLSGCMGVPHLHFNLFVIEGVCPFSIPVEFEQKG